MSADTDQSNTEAPALTAERRRPEKLPPCTSCQPTSPKIHELRTRYEASHPVDSELDEPVRKI